MARPLPRERERRPPRRSATTRGFGTLPRQRVPQAALALAASVGQPVGRARRLLPPRVVRRDWLVDLRAAGEQREGGDEKKDTRQERFAWAGRGSEAERLHAGARKKHDRPGAAPANACSADRHPGSDRQVIPLSPRDGEAPRAGLGRGGSASTAAALRSPVGPLPAARNIVVLPPASPPVRGVPLPFSHRRPDLNGRE